ncbi:MAG: SDR family oxidoreductase, partial [Terriglobia bacterium]
MMTPEPEAFLATFGGQAMNPAASGNPFALITGASRGIGYAVAAALAGRGHRLALLARSSEPLQAAAQRLAKTAPAVRAFPCEVREPAQVRQAISGAVAWGGPVDVLVNNAGIGVFGPIHEVSEQDWDRVLDTNLRGVFLCSKAVIPGMVERGRGHIINISSLAGKNAFAGGAAYCASKWGLMGLTYCMAEDLRRYGI